MSEDLVNRLLDLIAEKFKDSDDFYGVRVDSRLGRDWGIIIHLYDDRNIVAGRVGEKVRVAIDLDHTRNMIEDMLYFYKYDKKFNEAKTDEERKKIDQELRMEKHAIFEDFKRRMFKKHLDGDVAYLARKYIWAEEIAREMSGKYGFDVSFEVEKPEVDRRVSATFPYAVFLVIFDLNDIDEEQVAHKVMKAIDAVLEAREMYRNDRAMNEFLENMGIKPSPTPKIFKEGSENVARGIVGKLRDLLFKRFKGEYFQEIELRPSYPQDEEKWSIFIDREPYNIFLVARVNGIIGAGTGPVDHWDGIRDAIWYYKYKRRLEKAKTEEEKERIRQIEREEERRAFHDFLEGKYEKYLNDKALGYIARRHIWANEIARRLSEKSGFSIKFHEDEKPHFWSTFDSTGMSDEQVIEEAMRIVDVMVEAGKMNKNEEMMNEFLVSIGIEPMKARKGNANSN
ncbi:MAG: hypothetical protein FGF52_03395 [Candidatus Brockarchaeota archaeon]|nr:hypothetical protein [Candidatus Brockarchaeota archaeon]